LSLKHLYRQELGTKYYIYLGDDTNDGDDDEDNDAYNDMCNQKFLHNKITPFLLYFTLNGISDIGFD
jgi:hypothetical protein